MTAAGIISTYILLSFFHSTMVKLSAAPATIHMNSKQLSEKVKTMMINELHLHSANGPKKLKGGMIIQDKIGESILTTTPNGICHLMDSSEISDCFAYLIDPRAPAVTAKLTMGLKRNIGPANATITLYEVGRLKGEFIRLGRATIDSKEIDHIGNLRIEILRNAKG